MAEKFKAPRFQHVDATGAPIVGSVGFYTTGTSTPITVYSNRACTTPLTNPVNADSNGRLPAVWLSAATLSAGIKAVAYADSDGAGSVIWTDDPYEDSRLTGADLGVLLYPRTAAEISAGVTPTSYQYPELNVRRYGALLNGSTSDMTAFQNANSVAVALGGAEIIFDGDTALKNLALSDKVSLRGIGRPVINLTPTAATDFAITATGTVGATIALTANATQGLHSLTVGSTTGLAVGDRVLVREATYVYSTSGRKQEINSVVSLTPTVITLSEPLIESYSMASSAEVCKLNAAGDFRWSGFDVAVATGANGGGVKLTYCADFDLDGLVIRKPAAYAGISLHTSARGKVRNNTVRDGQGSVIGGSSGLAMYLTDSCHHIDVVDNNFANYNQIEFGMRTRHCKFARNTCRSAVDSAINTHGSTNFHIDIVDNDIDGSDQYGIAIGNSTARTHDEYVLVARNRIANVGHRAISVASTSGDHNNHIRVEDNEIFKCKAVSAATVQAVFAQYTDDVFIERNRLELTTLVNAVDAGITVNNCTRATVRHNDIANATSGYGIQMTTVTGYTVDHNDIRNVATNVSTTGDAGTCLMRFNSADDTTVSIDAAVRQFRNSWGEPELAITGATPSVVAGCEFLLSQGGATNVTNFTSASEGQVIRVRFADGNSTVVAGASMRLAGGANFTGTTYDILTLQYRGTVWYEVARSVNA